MRICFVNPTKNLRPALVSLVNQLKQTQEITILTPGRTEECPEGVEIKRFPSVFLKGIRYTLPDFLKQKQLLEKSRPDIIHIWSQEYPTSWLPVLYGKKQNIPTVLTVGEFAGVSWGYGSIPVDFLAKIYARTIGKWVIKAADMNVLFGQYLKRDADRLGIKNSVAIHNGIDISKFRKTDRNSIREEFGIGKEEPIILNISRLVPVKRIKKTIQIARHIKSSGIKAKMLIVGEGSEKEKYKKRAKGLDIIFTGHRNDVNDIMHASDILILTSRSEGFPNVLMEAAVCGLPIVSSDVGGAREIVLNRKSGFLADPEKPEFLQRVMQLLLNKKLRKRMGKTGCRIGQKAFDIRKTAKKYLGLYRNLVSGN